MMSKNLKEKVNEIMMPNEMRERIIKNCHENMEEDKMKNNKITVFFKRPMVAVASLALCICMTSFSAMAASGKLQGFFKDIHGWNGAVVGTSYEQATEELDVNLISTNDTLEIEVIVVDPNKAPYIEFEQMGIQVAEITDINGTVIMENISSEFTDMQNGKANIKLSIENIPNGDYKLQITEIVGNKKADQPLTLYGIWECKFRLK